MIKELPGPRVPIGESKVSKNSLEVKVVPADGRSRPDVQTAVHVCPCTLEPVLTGPNPALVDQALHAVLQLVDSHLRVDLAVVDACCQVFEHRNRMYPSRWAPKKNSQSAQIYFNCCEMNLKHKHQILC